MKKIIKRMTCLLAICCFVSLLGHPACPAKAAADIIPAASDNLSIGLRSFSKLVATDNGYMRVFYDGQQINIEYYDDSFGILSKKSVAMELDIWGGFYAGSDAYYIVEGQSNTDESDTAEVIRVIQYDTDWNKVAAANITSDPSLFGGEVRYPFDYGCVEMAEYDGTLYIVTGHEGYVDPNYNQGHQGFLMVAVDEASMSGSIVDCDLWHSFAQYIAGKDSDLYVLEQSEGSRYTKLSKYNAETLKSTSIPVLKYGGNPTSAWAIACYASVDGMALSSDNVLCLGTSIDQSEYDNISSDTAHNIYLTVTPMSDFSESATTVKWLTDYSGEGQCFLGTKITKINDDRFMVSWEEYGASRTASTEDGLSESILHYLFIDGNGDAVSKEFTAAAPISECQPIVSGGKIVYYASNANMVNFYTIDAATGGFGKKVYRVAGENATWELVDDVLTISGTGDISVDTQAHYRRPVSYVSGGFYYSSNDNAWKPIRDKVGKIVIEEGITGIPENAFVNFDSLTEVEIKPGLKSIGDKAFYECDNLSKITIPASVTKIGDDFLWTGYYSAFDESHVTRATIYAPKDSYAIEYAKKNYIKYVIDDGDGNGSQGGDSQSGNGGGSQSGSISGDTNDKDDAVRKSISSAKVSGIKSSYAFNGKAWTPAVTVTLDNKKLKMNTDYKVSYAGNVNTGKAKVKIEGINAYKGTIQKTFIIVPKKMSILKLTSPKTKQIKASWKKDAQATGYQIQYAKNSKFKSGKKSVTITKKSTTSKKISKLTKKKKYYVRIRAYKTIDGKKYYGSWSKAKKVKCK
ncbi:MAG: leucine-rich repeat domain-containing protein [Lachnospiraceae bacterium]|nr:leucine-rich repeat domain-containing protein [Lachnospiraceae bacterium]